MSCGKEKTEIEAKFICPEGLALQAMLNALRQHGFHPLRTDTCIQTDVYFDTEDYKLLKSNTAVRIRQRGENYVGTCKVSLNQQGAVYERKELDWQLSEGEIKLWNEEKKPAIPSAVTDDLNIKTQSLRRVLVADIRREAAIIRDNENLQFELSLDSVIFRGHKGRFPYCEIEAELVSGNVSHFRQVIDNLQNCFKLQPAIDSKYKKGMMLAGKHGVITRDG
jgi:inorganic triphosphatase YgiF